MRPVLLGAHGRGGVQGRPAPSLGRRPPGPALLPTPSSPAVAMPPAPMPPTHTEPTPMAAPSPMLRPVSADASKGYQVRRTARLSSRPRRHRGRAPSWWPGCGARERRPCRHRQALPPRRLRTRRPESGREETATNSHVSTSPGKATNWLAAEAVVTSWSPCMPRARGELALSARTRA